MHRHPIAAYSRTEVALCLGLVGAVAAIVAPAFAAMRDARSVSTQHLKKVGEAARMYAADHDDRFPPVMYTRESPQYWWGEIQYKTGADGKKVESGVDLSKSLLMPYLKETKYLLDPAFPLKRRKVVGGVAFAYNHRYVGGHYALTEDVTPDTVRPALVSEIQNPAQTVLFADSARWNWFTPGQHSFLEENTFLDPPKPEEYPVFHGRHKGGVGDALMVDGHVRVYKPLPGDRQDPWRDAPAELGHLPQEIFDRQ